ATVPDNGEGGDLMLSVIVCTHDPRDDYLARVLAALASQSLDYGAWELLVVDNGSTEELGATIDLSWQPRARVVREDRLGLTHARLRGISETAGEILVFVDDDNVLDPDYLQVVGEIGSEWPFLGAWSGQLFGEFEVDPPAWAKPYVRMAGL